MESQFRTSKGKLFHSLTVEYKELKYCVVRECIVLILCALRRLPVDRVLTVGGIIEEKYTVNNFEGMRKGCLKIHVYLLLRHVLLLRTVSSLIQVSLKLVPNDIRIF